MDTSIASDLSNTTINAIKSLGAASNLKISPRSSYLLIGKKDAPENSRSEWYEDEFPQIKSVNIY